MKVILTFIILLGFIYSQDLPDSITIEESETTAITSDEVNLEILQILTDTDFDDQPTRIQNSDGQIQYVLLEYSGQEYLVAVDIDIYGNKEEEVTEEVSSFLELKLKNNL